MLAVKKIHIMALRLVLVFSISTLAYGSSNPCISQALKQTVNSLVGAEGSFKAGIAKLLGVSPNTKPKKLSFPIHGINEEAIASKLIESISEPK